MCKLNNPLETSREQKLKMKPQLSETFGYVDEVFPMPAVEEFKIKIKIKEIKQGEPEFIEP